MFKTDDIPVGYLRNLYKRAMSGKSVRAAVLSHCYMCMGWEDAREGIRSCTAGWCPLYPYRLSARQGRIKRDQPAAESNERDHSGQKDARKPKRTRKATLSGDRA